MLPIDDAFSVDVIVSHIRQVSPSMEENTICEKRNVIRHIFDNANLGVAKDTRKSSTSSFASFFLKHLTKI